MMECIVPTYFVSNGYLYITALLLFDHYFVVSQTCTLIFSRAFLLISNKCNLDYPNSLNKSKRFGQSKFAIDWPICIMIRTGARLACLDN